MIFWSICLEKVISGFKYKGHTLNHIAEMNIITIADKLDMSLDFNIKHNMHALEWKISTLINKNKSLINEINRNWRHPLNKKFESYRV